MILAILGFVAVLALVWEHIRLRRARRRY